MPPGIKDRLFELTRQQRQMSQALYVESSQRINSNDDAIRGEIARLIANFYALVGAGADVDSAYTAMVAAARNATSQYNARQREIHGRRDKNDWRQGLAGFYSEDEAETKCRHALTVTQALVQ